MFRSDRARVIAGYVICLAPGVAYVVAAVVSV